MSADELRVFDTESQLFHQVAVSLGQALSVATQRRTRQDPFDLGLAGGTVVTSVLPQLSAMIEAANVPTIAWSHLRVWWVDERFVPADSADRNDSPAIASLFRHCPDVQLKPMPADEGQGLDTARFSFQHQWDESMGDRSFDLQVIGMGPDGHVASLFPHSPQLQASAHVLSIDNSPKPPPQRLTLSMPVLQASSLTWVVTAGRSKARALKQALDQHTTVDDVPVSALRGPHTTWWVDAAAGAYVQKSNDAQ